MANRPSDPGGKSTGATSAPWADDEAPAERDPDTDDMFGDVAPAPQPGKAAQPPKSQAATPRAQSAADPAKPYVVLARKYRPSDFSDLIGQDAMVTTLRNAFATDRIAQAYMLTGVRGVGKTTTARILARGLNYSGPGTQDRPSVDLPTLGDHCLGIIESRHPDVVEMDAASNTGVDNVREIIEGSRYRPSSARYKVYIIDEVHMLSKGAFNALLKTLEEPPAHVKFIFATTEIRKVPVTVLSRCQRFDLRRVSAEALVAHFARIAAAEGAEVEPDALALIARASEGSVRDGLSILDQAIATGAAEAGRVTAAAVRTMLGLADRGRVFDLIEAVLGGDAAGALGRLAALHKDGADPLQLLSDLAETVHLASRAKVAGPAALGELLSETERTRASAMAERLSLPALARAWQMLLKGLDEAGRAPQPIFAVEMLLIRMAYTADLPTPEEILRGAGPRPVTRNSQGAAVTSAGRPSAETPRAALAALATTPAIARTAPSAAIVAPPDAVPELATFADVVALVGTRRDARLKVMLEESVSLVRYEPGQIDLYLLEGAPRELANELREKLNQWTGRKWMVAISREPGAKSIGQVAREREDAELSVAMRDPLVQAMLQHFPDAEVLGVRSLGPDLADAIGTGDPEDERPDSDYATG